jgi:fructose-specific phosphotransferase system component IIB
VCWIHCGVRKSSAVFCFAAAGCRIFLDGAIGVEARLAARRIASLVVVAREFGVSSDRHRGLSIFVLRLKAMLVAPEKAAKTRVRQAR